MAPTQASFRFPAAHVKTCESGPPRLRPDRPSPRQGMAVSQLVRGKTRALPSRTQWINAGPDWAAGILEEP